MKVGDSFEEHIKFDYHQQVAFLDAIGDVYPAHRLSETDEDNPQKRAEIVVQGTFAAASFCGLISKHFSHIRNMWREYTFVRPARLDEEYSVQVKVREIIPEENIIILKGYLRNSAGKICIDCNTRLVSTVPLIKEE